MVLQILRSLIGWASSSEGFRYQLISHLIKHRAFYYRMYHLADTLNNIKLRDAVESLHNQAIVNELRKSKRDAAKTSSLSTEEEAIIVDYLAHPRIQPTVIHMLTNGTFNLKGNKL
jgi:hypothetical protein